jgi:hypothetical protein
MSRNRKIVALDGAEAPSPQAQSAPAPAAEAWAAAQDDYADGWAEDWDEAPRRRRSLVPLLAPALGLLLIGGWSGWFAWANQAEILHASPTQAAGWVGLWAQPVVLVAVLWLLVMRSSLREAGRFADAAARLEAESARLEARLASTNGELSLAREFIAAQARDLDALGRQATERLSQHAERLAALIHANSTQIEAIGSVSGAALDNMERLRGQLPVLASAAKDVTNNIGTAGRAAHAQLQDLIGGFNRLNEFGEAAERLITTTRAELDAALAGFGERLAALDAAHADRVGAVERQGAALHGVLEGQHMALARFDGELAARHAEQVAAAARLAEAHTGIDAGLAAIEARIGTIAGAGATTGAEMSGRLTLLTAQLAEARAALGDTSTALGGVTDAAVRLLELIRAGAKHSGEELPRAIAQGEERLADIERRAIALGGAVENARAGGEALSAYVLATQEQLAATGARLNTLHEGIAGRAEAHGEALAGLDARLTALSAEATALTARTEAELDTALAHLRQQTARLVAEAREGGARTVATLAEAMGDQGGAAIEKAMRHQADAIAGQLEQAAAHAAGVAREAAMQMRNQLTKVDELVGNLERRVEHARNRAEEQVDHDFARRVALITESLNSNAIDIAKALDAEVGDTAWAAYLRGDRGIFTRRAVRLLDPAEAKAVMQLYADDTAFADHVSRYIHDFEAMLRQLLSTRDGHALGVTLLSSDMGKLYVALAQAIERLRN